MAAINFEPNSPSNGDTFTANGVTYTYDGTKWKTSIVSNDFFPNTGGTVSGNIVLDGELQHSGDTDTKLHFDTDTIKLDTAGSERFRVGSAGQLGIGGATYGTSGQVLTSGGASAAPSWSDADSGAEWTSGTSTSLSGSNSTTFSGLPTNVQQVTMTLSGVSWASGTAPMSFRLGSGGSDKTSGYTSHQIYLIGGSNPTDNNSSSAFELSTWTSLNHSVDGHVTFTNHTGNEWVCVGVFGTGQDDSHHLVTGRVTLDGALDRVTVRNVSDNFDAGSANVHYFTT